MSGADIRVSLNLQQVARALEEVLDEVAGQRVSFSLFVWTNGRANYIANSTDRAEIRCALLTVIDGWETGMPDVPAHKVS